MEYIFYNGKIITMEEPDGEKAIQNAPEAVWIKDGIISGVGNLVEMEALADKNAQKTDLKGKCLMPGFIDTHSHFVMNGQMSLCADLSECESYQNIIDTLSVYIKKNNIQSGEAVVGFGYDHNFLKEGGQPDKRILDQVSMDIPILIVHVSAHLGCANSAALSLAGIESGADDIEGGVIGRIEGTDEPSGYLEESGLGIIQRTLTPWIKSDVNKMLLHMQDIYLENGITTAQDGASSETDISILTKMSARRQLAIDIVSYPLMSSGGCDVMQRYGKQYEEYVNHFRIGGYKLVLDGSPQGKSAWLSNPYEGETDYCGYPWLQDEQVERYIEQAIKENKQLLAHCNGDAASEQYLNAYKKAVQNMGKIPALRPVMIHCQTVRNDQLDRMAALNMIASIFVGHVWYWGDVHMKNLGRTRGEHISPVRDAIRRGITVTFHQDTPVTKPDMLHSVWCAVNRLSRTGNVIGKDQAIPVYEALKAVTVNAAYQYFEENEKGSIATGKRADLVILDRSPLEVDPMAIRDIRVMETIKDGVTIYNILDAR